MNCSNRKASYTQHSFSAAISQSSNRFSIILSLVSVSLLLPPSQLFNLPKNKILGHTG